MDAPLSNAALGATPGVGAEKSSKVDLALLVGVLGPGLAIALALYLSGNREAAMVITGAVVTISIFAAPEIGIYLYCGMQALDELFLAEQGAILTPAKIIGPMTLVAYFVHPGRIRAPMLLTKKFVIAMVAFGFYGLASSMWALAPIASARYGGQIIVQALLVVVAIHRVSDRGMLQRLALITVAGGTIAALMIAGGGVSAHYTRATIAAFTNPNTTAMALSLVLAAIPAAWMVTPQRLIRYALLLPVPVLFIALMRTGSRSQLAAVVLCVPIALVLLKRAGILKRLAVPLICTVLALGLAQYVFSSGALDVKSQERLSALAEGDVDLGIRAWIWGTAFSVFLQQPWGFGYGNTASVLLEHAGLYKDVHSSILGPLVDGGVIAFLLFMYALWNLTMSARLAIRDKYGIPAMILVVFTLLSLPTHTIHFAKYFWVPVLLAWVLLEQDRRESLAETQVQPPRPVTPQDILAQNNPADAVVMR